MDWEDVKVPCALLCDSDSTDVILVYAMIRLHVDANGRCEKPVWLSVITGVPIKRVKEILEALERDGYVELYKYDGMYGRETGVRLLDWQCPTRHERMTGAAWKRLRAEVFARDNYTCAYCQQSFGPTELECDHIEPISKGGTNEKGNLVTACGPCNRRKHGNVIELWRGRA